MIITVSWTLFFNDQRFGSMLEFGAAYQLTVNDIRMNQLRLSAFPQAISAYFLQLPGLRSSFPWIQLHLYDSSSLGFYLYRDRNIGILAFPLSLFVFYPPKNPINAWSDRRSVKRYGYWYMMVISLIFIAWFDFCYAGSLIRYVCDISLPAALMAAVSLLSLNNHIQADNRSLRVKKYSMRIVSGIFTATIIMGTLILLSF